ncbi:acetyl-CoA carboxylase biotin carboxyl carrier protein [Litoreibacter ascidiaceicola]|uniref:Biotin carboxyl carrier protein of acetyl-CoA carboxylase n=1 Tax=Litoreibacter ascidiaceicola TaxID=1486859 RepID=A0A1M4SXG5_9RHOB|nr:acetyl-CoA carboxylase biotin carboxyl carrier protein [Litoreibacter ascidiaceicola]SHE36896.1 acetyl-CoA carboxylase biotin carboxyl carrier protein [Litoreibacter ascidiaceicola]
MAKNSHDGDVAFVKALAEVLKSNDLTELEVKREYGEDDSLNVRVSKQVNVVQQSVAAAPVAAAAPAAAAAAPVAAAPAASGDDDPAQHPGAVTSPMVGTCYLQAEPGTPPFAAVGDKVTEGQTVMIIEAMKTMNHIPAPKSGTVKRVLVEDGTPVEFGAPLMIVE